MFDPVIKWSGSKRSQASKIISFFPKEIGTYYEPFLGGGSVFRTLCESGIKVGRYVLSDINSDLIDLWNVISTSPSTLISTYAEYWNIMNKDVPKEDQIYRQNFYDRIRKEFNQTRSPYKFMFLNRTCFNGLIRYNSKGEFNSPFHLNRNGIRPDKFTKIIIDWDRILQNNNVEFRCCSYDDITPDENDFVYLDPPYANTKGMYYDCFDNQRLFAWMRNLHCGYALSYDGMSGDDDNTYQVPPDLYNEHKYILSGNSSFKRITKTNNNANVFESLYLKNHG